MRSLALAVVALAGCRVALHETTTADLLYPQQPTIHVVLVGHSILPYDATTDEGVRINARDTVIDALAQELAKDPRVQVDQPPADLKTACSDHTTSDFIISVATIGDTGTDSQCALATVVSNGKSEHEECAITQEGTQKRWSRVSIDVYEAKRCEPVELGKSFHHGGDGTDWQPLLAKDHDAALAWTHANAAQFFARQVLVDDHASIPIGASDTVHVGDTYLIERPTSEHAGYARVAATTATSASLESMIGPAELEPGFNAVQRGKPWSLAISPTAGVAKFKASDTDATFASMLGIQARAYPFDSGPVLGLGIDLYLFDGKFAASNALQAGWSQRISSGVELHAIGSVALINSIIEDKVKNGVGLAAVIGANFSARFGYAVLEGGYQWANKLTVDTTTMEYRGPLVRLSLGFSMLGN